MPRDSFTMSASASVFSLDGCTAWLHSPPPGMALDHAVVMCNPLGAACVTVHRNWRQFACMLAQAGFPTLRFDYPGTGDSGEAGGQGQIAAALASVGNGIDWLRAHTGATHITLCGLRFGALLAAQAAAAYPGLVTGLALLAPPPSGRAYLRELQIGALTRNLPAEDGVALEVDGLRLTAPDFAVLRELQLPRALAAARPAKVLVANPNWQVAPDHVLERAVVEAGASLTRLDFPGLRDFLKPAYKSLPPEDTFEKIIAWMRPADCTPATDIRPPGLAAQISLSDGITEEAFRFGDDGGLFGIACLPARPVPGVPAALILNTGAEPHTGHSRFSVLLARRLAAMGMASFRIDVTGLGDSSRPALPILPPGTDAADYSEDQLAWMRVFHPEFVDDVNTALAEMERRGFARFVPMGICSGANLALHAAHDARVAGVVLVNPNLSPRGEIPFLPANKPVPVQRPLLRAALRRGLDAVRLHENRRNRIRASLRVWREHAVCQMALRTGDPAHLHVKTRWFWTLRKRGIGVLAISSVGDEALPDWRRHAAPLWPHMGGPRRGLPRIIGDSHSFEPIALRDELIDAICTHVAQVHLP